ncbi:hypothetical protein YC2023_018505 [Brassica napus]
MTQKRKRALDKRRFDPSEHEGNRSLLMEFFGFRLGKAVGHVNQVTGAFV